MKSIKRAGARNETVVNGETMIATVHHFTEHDQTAKDEGYQFTTYLDFKGVSQVDLITLASQTVIIRARSKLGFRSLDPDKTNNQTVNVASFLKSSKKRRNPEKVASRVAKDLAALGYTDEKIREVLESLKA